MPATEQALPSPQASPRKIVHVDMDAFYASVEQRDQPALRGRPVIVAWKARRSVVCAASYEARAFGIHSAMPALRAARLCPQAVFLPPDFPRYRAVSQAAMAIYRRYTALIEPLSLDEAYLDVSQNMAALPTATAVAEAIRAAVRAELQLTVSAGVAPNKFLAKIASDWNKPDGLCVIRPQQAQQFLLPLPVRKIPGVGRVMQARLHQQGIHTIADLHARSPEELGAAFGSAGAWLHRRARGLDDSPVQTQRPVQSLSAEDTFGEDLTAEALPPLIENLCTRTWRARQKTTRVPRTVTLKLKTADFRLLTRSHTPITAPDSEAALRQHALGLLLRLDQPTTQRYRLVGVGLGNFRDAEDCPAQGALFA